MHIWMYVYQSINLSLFLFLNLSLSLSLLLPPLFLDECMLVLIYSNLSIVTYSYKFISLSWFISIYLKGSSRSKVANVLDSDIILSELELQSRYYTHFRTNIFWKGINSLIPPV